ncbi:MAG: ribonuclease HIII, partial [Blastochloris sp.]|nr:ribonuclease HIII [Blastochloris sp.]
MEQSSFTFQLNAEQGKTLQKLVSEQQFEISELPYGHFRASKGKCGVQYYHSGKVVIQGKGAREFIEFYMEPLVMQEARLGYEEELNPEMYSPHFGIDEAGKGDFFGPLVIAGAYVDAGIGRKLREKGIRDSKTVASDKRIFELADIVREVVGPRWEVVSIGPKRYNEMYGQFRNLNRLLAWGHVKVIENLAKKVPDCPRALSDQFARADVLERELAKKKLSLKLEQRTKGESDLAVAAASILAREGFLLGMNKLSEQVAKFCQKGRAVSLKKRPEASC